jgi:RimJ/RimL family protein N-acetyltransferase
MFKIASVTDTPSLKEARAIIDRVYRENPSYWPHGINVENFDGGLYLIREKRANTPVGFAGWQERYELDGSVPVKVGYYSIGVLPEYRRNGFAKEAIAKLIHLKSAGVDRVRAYIMEHNKASQSLAADLGVEQLIKKTASYPGVTGRNLFGVGDASWRSFCTKLQPAA